jgi:hypothetical protein
MPIFSGPDTGILVPGPLKEVDDQSWLASLKTAQTAAAAGHH